MKFVSDSITFSPLSGHGPRTDTKDVSLGATNRIATAILTGWNISYSHGDDHHLGNVQVAVSATLLDPSTARVTATFGLRDWSGNWDDDYEGQIYFTVIAE